jgi:hypothetical protein
VYGPGQVAAFRRSDGIYSVTLKFGATAYLRTASVLSSLLLPKPEIWTWSLRMQYKTHLNRPGDQIAMGTQSLYLFFRLYHILIRRLIVAKQLAFTVDNDKSLCTMVEPMYDSNPTQTGRRRYDAFLALVYSLLDGLGTDPSGGKYEDRVRSLLGHGAFELATMDKLISHLWKTMQTLSQDEVSWNLIQLYRRHAKSQELWHFDAFRIEAGHFSEGEPMYAFQHCHVPEQDCSVLHMEYIGPTDEHAQFRAANAESFAAWRAKAAQAASTTPMEHDETMEEAAKRQRRL